MRKVALALLLIACAACKHDVVKHVVMKEQYDENGFNLELGYHTPKPLIIANVVRTFELFINNTLISKSEARYTEYFEMGRLPANNAPPNQTYPPAEWAKISTHAGKRFFLTDKICAGPAQLAATNQDTFRVVIKSNHELYTGGTIQNRQAHLPGNPGSAGYVKTDANGNGPSVKTTHRDGTVTDHTTQWETRNVPRGRVTKQGKKQLTIAIVHTGDWGRAAGDRTWSVDWEYKRKIGDGQELKKTGNAQNTTPRPGPAPAHSCR